MKQWWHNLTPREQKVVMFGAIILLIMIVHFFIWSPLSDSVDLLKQNVSQDRDLLTWMKLNLPRIDTTKIGAKSAQPVNPADMFATVQQSIATSGLKSETQNIEQQKVGTIKVSFNAVGFDNLMNWLIILHRDFGITPIEVHLDRIAEEGTVKGEVLLQSNLK